MTSPPFDYFHGPVNEMAHVAEGQPTCSYCGNAGPCFRLPDAKSGCFDCLRGGRFGFLHETEAGLLFPGRGLRPEGRAQRRLAERLNLPALLRTPQYVTWQGERWLVHCDDFMTYLGEWKPRDFIRHSVNGDGRTLFREMVEDPHLARLWDETTPAGAAAPDSWYFHVHAFRCRHCGKLRGHWDCA